MFGASEISISSLLSLKHMACSPDDCDDFFLAGICEFAF